jgi:hypothetical protein
MAACRNPVRRGLVEKLEDWEWSSYRHYLTGEPGVVEIESQWTARVWERLGWRPQPGVPNAARFWRVGVEGKVKKTTLDVPGFPFFRARPSRSRFLNGSERICLANAFRNSNRFRDALISRRYADGPHAHKVPGTGLQAVHSIRARRAKSVVPKLWVQRTPACLEV